MIQNIHNRPELFTISSKFKKIAKDITSLTINDIKGSFMKEDKTEPSQEIVAQTEKKEEQENFGINSTLLKPEYDDLFEVELYIVLKIQNREMQKQKLLRKRDSIDQDELLNMSQQSGSENGELVEIDTNCFQTILDTLKTDKGVNTDLLQTI